ncbi:MAG TPA: type VI secretion system baseplate subunit TssG [Pyrinomonadaceae bacterium]|jgi:type VI secretion system protein ImpH
MAAEDRGSGLTIEETLDQEAYRFEFFQAVRLLERLLPGRAPVGRHDTPPGGEAVRFRTRPTLQFPPSEVYEVARAAGDEAPAEMTVAFMGLTGPSGVLPSHTTELVAERARAKDTALWEFLDLFGHRMVSLFYRAWERYRFTVSFERGRHDELTDDLFALVGMGTRGLRGRLGLPDHALIYYGGLVAQRPHSAGAVESVLGDYFGVPARLEPFTGQWLELDEESRTRLGRANSRLGESTVAGARVWDAQSKFRVWFGPLKLSQFERLLPAGPDYPAAVRLGRLMCGAELDFDMRLVLKAREVPDCVLGEGGVTRPRLGWTTWLKTRPLSADDSQVLLQGAA